MLMSSIYDAQWLASSAVIGPAVPHPNFGWMPLAARRPSFSAQEITHEHLMHATLQRVPFPEIVAALTELPVDAVPDCELVVVNQRGHPVWASMRRRAMISRPSAGP